MKESTKRGIANGAKAGGIAGSSIFLAIVGLLLIGFFFAAIASN
jgi:hypothetical protein